MRHADVESDQNILTDKLKLHKVQGKSIPSKRKESCKESHVTTEKQILCPH